MNWSKKTGVDQLPNAIYLIQIRSIGGDDYFEFLFPDRHDKKILFFKNEIYWLLTLGSTSLYRIMHLLLCSLFDQSGLKFEILLVCNKIKIWPLWYIVCLFWLSCSTLRFPPIEKFLLSTLRHCGLTIDLKDLPSCIHSAREGAEGPSTSLYCTTISNLT